MSLKMRIDVRGNCKYYTWEAYFFLCLAESKRLFKSESNPSYLFKVPKGLGLRSVLSLVSESDGGCCWNELLYGEVICWKNKEIKGNSLDREKITKYSIHVQSGSCKCEMRFLPWLWQVDSEERTFQNLNDVFKTIRQTFWHGYF